MSAGKMKLKKANTFYIKIEKNKGVKSRSRESQKYSEKSPECKIGNCGCFLLFLNHHKFIDFNTA